MESGSRPRVRVPSAGQACPPEVCPCPSPPSAHRCVLSVLCGSQPCAQGPGPERRGRASGHTGAWDRRPQCRLRSTGFWQRAPGGSPAHRRTGGWAPPCPLCSALSGCWSAGCGRHVHGDLRVGSGAGQVGRRTGAAGCGEQTSRCPLLGCCFARPRGALTRRRAGRGGNHCAGPQASRDSGCAIGRLFCPAGADRPSLGPPTLVGTRPEEQQL